MEDICERLLGRHGVDYLEVRFHRREFFQLRASGGEFEGKVSGVFEGYGVRVLVDGAWGFSATSSDLEAAVERAVKMARACSRAKKEKAELGEARLATGEFTTPLRDDPRDHSVDEKVEMVLRTERAMREEGVAAATVLYREYVDKKHIWTSDGANVRITTVKPSAIFMAYAREGDRVISHYRGHGVTGGWDALFTIPMEERGRAVAREAMELLHAPLPEGGKSVVVLHPDVVGLLAHEAVGHNVEADMVLSGSFTTGKIGQKVASELITMVDSGDEGTAAGTIFVDDEGVIAGKTVVIEKGVLKSYLLDRERAAIFGTESTGNARAFEFTCVPLIRMRNTYIEPGDWRKEEIIEDTKDGYFLEGGLNGQADSNGEFMFGIAIMRKIEKGEIVGLCRGTTMTGNAFEVLKNVDAVSREFQFAMGFGHCGKWQPAKVDGGGPYLRTTALIGGR